jgi:hypothetical protein
MTKNNKMYTAWGERIKRNGTLLNIEFKTKVDARLCCKLLNQQDNDISYYINHLNEIFTWHKEHYGKSILDERLEFKSDCEKENELLKKENDDLKKENKELKDKNSQLQETLAFRSNQLALMERLVDDLGSEEMARQMEEILND